MIQILPAIINGKASKLFITSDHTQHDTFEEAEWHEFITNELKIDALTFEFPHSNCAITFKSNDDLERFLAKKYEECELKILNDLDQMEFPNRYIMLESVRHYGVENRLVEYTISFTEMNEFKRMMIGQIMSL